MCCYNMYNPKLEVRWTELKGNRKTPTKAKCTNLQ